MHIKHIINEIEFQKSGLKFDLGLYLILNTGRNLHTLFWNLGQV